MQRRYSVVQDRSGNAISGASITVTASGGGLATLYSDNGVTPTSNPVTANANGEYAYYAANGTYSEVIAAAGYGGESIPGIVLFDPKDSSVAGISNVSDPGLGGFWKDTDSGAVVMHQRDRFFIGAGSAYTGNKNAPFGGTWLNTLVASWPETNAQGGSLSQNGRIGWLTGTSLTTGETTGSAIGHASFSYCNLAGGTARAGYFDATHNTGTASYGIEIALSNQGTDITANSYSVPGGVFGLKMSPESGLGYVVGDSGAAAPQATAPSTAALLVQAGTGAATPQQFRTGILFGSNALVGSDGTNGTAEAIAMGKGHALNWYAGSSILGATVRSDVTAVSGHDVGIVFSNDTISFQATASASSVPILSLVRDTVSAGGVNYLTLTSARTNTNPTFQAAGSDTNVGIAIKSKGTGVVQFFTNGGEAFRVAANPASAVNFVQAVGSATGSAVVVSAQGSDTNIDLQLSAKGTGLLKTGYASTSATTPANFTADRYLAIKDSTGTTYYVPCRASPW
jgi:hypothetical protein